MDYGTAVHLPTAFDETVQRVRTALSDEGFGVLTEIDVRATMKAKLDEDVPAQVILGACNPQLALRALRTDPSIGLLLPCNVVVREVDDGTLVELLDPHVMVSATGDQRLDDVAEEAGSRLAAVAAALRSAA